MFSPVPTRRRLRPVPAVLGAMAALLLNAVAAPGATTTDRPVTDADVKLALTVFDEVWTTVEESYFDPDFEGVDWAAVREDYRPRVRAAAGEERALRKVLNEMLTELSSSHFGVLPSTLGALTEGGGDGTTGLQVAVLDDALVVRTVEPEGPAAGAGVRPGDRLLAVNEVSAESWKAEIEAFGVGVNEDFVWSYVASQELRGPVGSAVTLTLQAPGAEPREVSLKRGERIGTWVKLLPQMPPMRVDVMTAEPAPGIALLALTTFGPTAMEPFRDWIRAHADGEGLILDLRGNPGGFGIMAAGMTGMLVDEETRLGTMFLRSGHLNFVGFPQPGAYTGPFAVLIDEGSASTSEILAGGLQEAGRARIFGRTSAGAALPSYFRKLANGDVLQYAIADFRLPSGQRVEEQGVVPDEQITPAAEQWRAGEDPTLEAAVRWIASHRE